MTAPRAPLGAIAALEQAPVALLVLDGGAELRVAIANARYREMFAAPDAQGRRGDQAVGPEVHTLAQAVLASGEATQITWGTLPDPVRRIALEPLRDDAGAVHGVILAFEDITEDLEIRHALCETGIEARQASARKDRFITAAAHEVRAPLMTLLLWEDLLRSGKLGSDDQTRALDAIKDSAAELSRLLGDLQDVSRAIAGTLQLGLGPIDLDVVMRDASEAFAPRARTAELVFDTQISPGLGTVHGNDRRLRQVLDALLENARRHTPAGGRITLAARRTEVQVEIEVRDTGSGIPSEQLAHVFEPFSRSDDELAPPAGGLGLGLAIARELVRLHGGSLGAASPGRNGGATFTLTLPITAS